MNEYAGPERRVTRGRPLYSRGPIIVILEVAQVVTFAGIVVVMVIAIMALNGTTSARRDSARDSCRLLLGLVHAATSNAPMQRAAANAYVHRTPLHDCQLYARRLVP